MRIRTFTADNAQAAMAKVRAEMGPDAVIIAMDETAKGGGVMVRAAVEPSSEPASQTLGEDGRPVLLSAFEDRLDQLLKTRLRAPQHATRPFGDAGDIAPALAFHRVPERIATALSNAAVASRHTDAETALAHALNRHIDLTPLPAVPDRPILLVGAPGAGKTGVAARLALRAAASGAAPLLITLDGEKAGARAQIETYAAHLKFDARIVENAESARAVAANYSAGPIFIDSTGFNIFDTADLRGMRRGIGHLAADVIAVMPAGLDAEEAADAAGLYADAGVKQFICTRTDAARRFGSLIAAAASGLGLAQFTSSPLISRGLDAPDARALARMLLETDAAIANARAA